MNATVARSFSQDISRAAGELAAIARELRSYGGDVAARKLEQLAEETQRTIALLSSKTTTEHACGLCGAACSCSGRVCRGCGHCDARIREQFETGRGDDANAHGWPHSCATCRGELLVPLHPWEGR